MSSEDFAAYEDLMPPIVLRAHGKEYELPVVGWEHGVELQRRIAERAVSEGELIQELLGRDLVAKLLADGVPDEFIDRVGAVAFADWKFGRETAKKVWADPKATAQQIMQAIQAIQQTAATATMTPTPASQSSTTSPKRKRKAAPSNGAKS
jgi:hypothetical protein